MHWHGRLRIKPRSGDDFLCVELKVKTSSHIDKVISPLMTVEQVSDYCHLDHGLETSVIVFKKGTLVSTV